MNDSLFFLFCLFFFLQAKAGIRYLVRSRGLGDVYKRQPHNTAGRFPPARLRAAYGGDGRPAALHIDDCLLYTSDAAAERSSGELGGRRILKKKHLLKVCACSAND